MRHRYTSEKKESLKRKEKALLGMGLAFFSVLVFAFYFVYPFQTQTSKPPLKFTSPSKDLSFISPKKNKTDSLLQIELNKTELSKQIQELSDELFETKTRLIQLKKDILVKGGQKETAYLEKILKLENELEKVEFESVKKDIAIAEKEEFIAELEEENKKIENAFLVQREQLQEVYENALVDYESKLTDVTALFSKINEELSLSEYTPIENFDTVLENFKNEQKKDAGLSNNTIDVIADGFIPSEPDSH